MNQRKWIFVLPAFLLLLTLILFPNEDSFAKEDLAVPSVNGSLQVTDGRLKDENGNPIQLRGISTHGLSWFPEYINQDCIKEIKEWGADLLRLAMYTSEDGGYCTGGDQEALKDLIRAGVSYATEADMYVIVDWHILSEGSPTVFQDEAERFFSEMSAEFADHNNVLYEICNEPTTADWPTIKAYAEDIIPIIRANDPDAIIIVGTPAWSQEIDKPVSDPISDWDNIMYTLHFYAATHKEDLRERMTAAADAGLPIFVTEYGICDASGDGALDTTSADEWIRLMNKYGISYAVWNLSNNDESSSIFSSDVTKTSGFTYEDLSESGRWVYNMLQNALEEPSIGESSVNDSAGEKPDSLAASLSMRTSWENEDGSVSYIYDITLTNHSDNTISGWTINILFNEDISVSDEWNGTYTCRNDTLVISNADYNGSLEPNATITDIGFIVTGSSALLPLQKITIFPDNTFLPPE